MDAILVALSGAKTYIGRADNDILNGKRDLSWAITRDRAIPRASAPAWRRVPRMSSIGKSGEGCFHALKSGLMPCLRAKKSRTDRVMHDFLHKHE